MLAEFGDVAAFELDDEARDIARHKLPIDIKPGILPEGIPFAPESFDIIAAFDVIEHVEKDVESLNRLKEHLAPGGRLVMTVPALPWLWSRHDETHHHYRRYTRRHLEETLRQAGLTPVRISYFNTLLFPLIAGIRLLKKMAGRRDSDDDAMPGRLINETLKRIFGLESSLVPAVDLPIGVSLLAIAERPR